jgi:hypothetical protein
MLSSDSLETGTGSSNSPRSSIESSKFDRPGVPIFRWRIVFAYDMRMDKKLISVSPATVELKPAGTARG